MEGIDKEDIISVRKSGFGAEVLVADKEKCSKKYEKMVMENIAHDDFMIIYVIREMEKSHGRTDL